jgi:hypothetical protein
MPRIVIASRLSDGRTVFLGSNASWMDFIQESRIANTTEEDEEIMQIARESEGRQEVVDPYLVDVEAENGKVRALHHREAIRAAGPTIRRDLGKQAES